MSAAVSSPLPSWPQSSNAFSNPMSGVVGHGTQNDTRPGMMTRCLAQTLQKSGLKLFKQTALDFV